MAIRRRFLLLRRRRPPFRREAQIQVEHTEVRMYNLLPCVVSPCLTNARISSFVWFLDSICSSIRRRRWIAREGASTRRWAHTLPPCVASNTEGCTIERFSFYFFDRMRSRIWWWRWTAREGRSTRGGSKHEQSKHTEVIDCWYQVPPPPPLFALPYGSGVTDFWP
jgi:hypothetical protein